MALELYMLGLIVQDIDRSLEFYQRLGLAIPQGGEKQTHVEIKMGSRLTFFLDSRPARWDPGFVGRDNSRSVDASDNYHSVLEFYLETQDAVDIKYAQLIGLGYQSQRAPYETSFGMYFAMINDPDGNTILLSGDLKEDKTAKED